MNKYFDDNSKKCPMCNKDMVLKKGRYGYFWGCTNYPKCTGSIDANKHRIKLEKLVHVKIGYDSLLENGEMDVILFEILENDKKTREIAASLHTMQDKLKNNNFCYKIIEYLHKRKRYIDISKVIYSINKVRGEVPIKFKYWINNKDYDTEYVEKDIKRVMINTWKENIFSNLSLRLIGEEVFIGNFDEGGGKVDILAENKINNTKVIIEIKGPKANGRKAWGQLNTYLDTYKKVDNKDAIGLIVSRGYPFGIYENKFILIGYVIEKNEIAFIPWKI